MIFVASVRKVNCHTDYIYNMGAPVISGQESTSNTNGRRPQRNLHICKSARSVLMDDSNIPLVNSNVKLVYLCNLRLTSLALLN
jgi:hypothetical protein